ncbi:MAG TPA: hypothetical protein VJ824_04940 [Bacillota bacterium]|nr:hypothetical protein [Bacillota bacterium]
MIEWESQFKQILSDQCVNCSESYFAPYSNDLPHVGCCSYSPSFTLFEIYKMILCHSEEFFWEHIYRNPRRDLYDFKIIIRANVSNPFQQIDKTGLSIIQVDDLRLQFSICQFFVLGKGCGLNPAFKNETCRSFICHSVENQLSVEQSKDLNQWIREIQSEVKAFNTLYENFFRSKEWTFLNHMQDIVRYFREIIDKGE